MSVRLSVGLCHISCCGAQGLIEPGCDLLQGNSFFYHTVKALAFVARHFGLSAHRGCGYNLACMP